MDNLKRSNICIIGVPEGKEKEQEFGKLLGKIMKENFHDLVKGVVIQVQESQRVPKKTDVKRPTPRDIIIKIPEVKDKESSKKQEKSS